MADNVLQFPEHRRKPEPPDTARRVEHETARRMRVSKLVEAVRGAAFRGERLKVMDRPSPAREIYRLLGQAKAKGHKREITTAITAEGIRLYRMIINERKAEAEEQNDRGGLIPHVASYLKALELFAKELNAPLDELIDNAFDRTERFGGKPARPADDPHERVALLLNAAANSVIQKFQMHRRFDLLPEGLLWKDLFGHGGWSGSFQEAWAAPALPRAPIGRVLRTAFTGPLQIESRRVDSSAGLEERLRRSTTVEAKISLYTAIWIAIGPISGPSDLGPLFDCVSVIELSIGGKLRRVTQPHWLWGGTDGAQALIKLPDGWHRVKGFGDGWSVDGPLDHADEKKAPGEPVDAAGLVAEDLYAKRRGVVDDNWMLCGLFDSDVSPLEHFYIRFSRIDGDALEQLTRLEPEFMGERSGPGAEPPGCLLPDAYGKQLETTIRTEALRCQLEKSAELLFRPVAERAAAIERNTKDLLERWSNDRPS
jgi:hypothetical protein